MLRECLSLHGRFSNLFTRFVLHDLPINGLLSSVVKSVERTVYRYCVAEHRDSRLKLKNQEGTARAVVETGKSGYRRSFVCSQAAQLFGIGGCNVV